MDDLVQVLIGVTPVLGGLVLGIFAANYVKGPDVRGSVKDDLDLLDRLPAGQTQRRAELQRSIDLRIDALIAGVDRSRALREAAISYRGNWRDVVVFVSTVLFTYIWWYVDHSRSNWLPMFMVLIFLSVLALVYAASGVIRAVTTYRRSRRNAHHCERPLDEPEG
jgi:hypothetical protein